jgi:flagellar hook-length control protein FliK
MLDSKNILLDIAKPLTPRPAASAEQVQDNAADSPEPFLALMSDAVAKLKAAKSGNTVPLAEPSKVPAGEAGPETLMSSRTLKGGTALIVGGAEPTDEGLIAFAQAQGMDPMALGLQVGKTNSLMQGSGTAHTPALTGPGSSPNPEHQNLAKTQPKLALQTGKFISDQQRIQAEQISAAASGKALGVEQLSVEQGKLSGAQSGGDKNSLGGSSLAGNSLDKYGLGKNSLGKNSLGKNSLGKNSLDIKPNSILAGAKLALESEMPKIQSQVAKLIIEPKIAQVFKQQVRESLNVPPTKLDAINLDQSRVLALSSSGVTSGAAPVAAAPIVVEGQTAGPATLNPATAANITGELSADSGADELKQDLLRRQDDFMQLSRQLTDALGKRLTAQIQRGSWHVEMELHPRSLGRVEVQLEMKNGELEARFITANATTRDLINEGMPRLREAFQEHGTETAYKNLGEANQGAPDGKSTASDRAAEALNERSSSEIETDSPKANQSITANGLNVLV